MQEMRSIAESILNYLNLQLNLYAKNPQQATPPDAENGNRLPRRLLAAPVSSAFASKTWILKSKF